MSRTALMTQTIFLATVIILLSTASLVIGATDNATPTIKTDSYCTRVGDDNCDGVIMSYESGWKCVPPNGGPLLCEVGNDK